MPKRAECEICTHEDRYIIEQSVNDDTRIVFNDDIESAYGFAHGTVQHHMRSHVTAEAKREMTARAGAPFHPRILAQSLTSQELAKLLANDMTPAQRINTLREIRGYITFINSLEARPDSKTDAEQELEEILEIIQESPELAEIIEEKLREKDAARFEAVDALLTK